MTVASRFDITSCGKTSTGACIALLAHEGSIALETPFTEYLPEPCLGKSYTVTIQDRAMHIGGFDNRKPYSSDNLEMFLQGTYNKRPVWARQTHDEYACANFMMLGLIA